MPVDYTYAFVAVEMGDDTNLPVNQGSTNYYIAEQQVFPDGDRGRIKLLAFLGCQMGARTFVYELADKATREKMTRTEVQSQCWQYINALHEANKTVKQSKRPMPSGHAEVRDLQTIGKGDLNRIAKEQHGDTEQSYQEYVARKNAAKQPKHDVAADVNEALDKEL